MWGSQVDSRGITQASEAKVSVRQSYLAGAKDDARSINAIKRLLAEHPGDPAVRHAARNLHRLQWAGWTNVYGATAVDAVDKGADKLSGSYRDFKDCFAFAEGTLK
jgi:hypothetical protein